MKNLFAGVSARSAALLFVAACVLVPGAAAQPLSGGDVLTACAGSAAPLKLQIIHSSDNESSFQDPNTLEPKILHYATVVEGLKEFGARRGFASIHVTAGDHTIPGPFYQAAAQVPELGARGLGDIAIYNFMNVIANGIGNHEFDGGINDFAYMLNAANYPFVAVNLDFSDVSLAAGVPWIQVGRDRDLIWSEGPSFFWANTFAGFSFRRGPAGKVVKSAVVKVRDQCVGFIGRAPADFFNVIKDPETTMPGLDFVGGKDDQNQPLVSAIDLVLEEVDRIQAMGINKIILIDHAQDFTGDPLSANKLRGIDVVVAAGSTGFMASPAVQGPFNLLREGDTQQAAYPTIRSDSENAPVAVVNSDQLYRYAGNLMLTFDPNGVIVDIDGKSGPVATTMQSIELLADELQKDYLLPPVGVQYVFSRLRDTPLVQNLFQAVGTTVTPLNGQRADVRTRETNLGRLAADSTLDFARQDFPSISIDCALKNGGGIRDTIQGPSITRLTVQAALAFNNKLAVLQLTGSQLLAAMENAVSRVPAADGRYPQIAGMTLEFDASRPGIQGEAQLNQASRVRNLTIERADGTLDVLVQNGLAQGDLSRTFVLATNDFLSTGGDGYAALAAATKLATTTTGEQLILEQYIQQRLGGVVNIADPPPSPRVVRLDQ